MIDPSLHALPTGDVIEGMDVTPKPRSKVAHAHGKGAGGGVRSPERRSRGKACARRPSGIAGARRKRNPDGTVRQFATRRCACANDRHYTIAQLQAFAVTLQSSPTFSPT